MIPATHEPRARSRDLEPGAARLAAILDSSQDAIVAWSLDWSITDWNRGAERLFGYRRDQALKLSVRALWPAEVTSTIEYMVARLCQDEEVARFETALLRHDGGSVEVSVTITAIRDAGGRVIGVSSISQDISARKRVERVLAHERTRWEAAFRKAPIGMALVDLGGAWLAVNDALCRLLGRDEETLLASDLRSLTHPDDREADLAKARRAAAGELEDYETETRYLLEDGTAVWMLHSAALVRDLDGGPLYFVSQLQDITVRKQSEQELARYADQLGQLARRDPVTGLDNYREFHSLLNAELQRSRRYGGEWSVVLFDIDDFTRLNADDHARGDRALNHTGRAIADACRTADRAARIGADEFALILPDTGQEQARAAAARVTAAVAGTGSASLSWGVATWPHDGATIELLLLRADMGLQTARRRPSGPSPRTDGIAPGLACPTDAVREIVMIARQFLAMDVAYLAAHDASDQTFVAVSGDGASFGIERGDVRDLEGSYCRRMLAGRVPSAVPDVSAEPELADLAMTRQSGIGAYLGVPVELNDGRCCGTLCALSHEPVSQLEPVQVDAMRSFASLIANHIEHDQLNATAHRDSAELAGINALLSALMARDHYTAEHSRTVVELSSDVGRHLGLGPDEIHEVEQVALLHDIGKVGVPDQILQKQGPLNDYEWELMRQHPAIGARILAGTPTLAHLAPAVNAEHERFDGTGYPDGLRGEAIPLASRITFACDAYHAITSDRPYRKALSADDAQRELQRGSGTQFDPDVVAALLHVLSRDRTRGPDAPRSQAAPRRDVLNARIPRQTPHWEPATASGEGSALGTTRGVCRRCGAHTSITVTAATVGGCCGNCGSYDITPLLESAPASRPAA